MTVTVERTIDKKTGKPKKGCSDDWTARCEGLKFLGVGRDRDQALGSMLRANLPALGVTEYVDKDPLSPTPTCVWNGVG